MKKRFLSLTLAACLIAGAIPLPVLADPGRTADTTDSDIITMFRLYNPNSGEHFYTASAKERDILKGYGWNDEGTGWIAPKKTDDPVYRLYNPNSGDHHYTLSAEERDHLDSIGWNYEGIGWYSADSETGAPLYRQFNPNAKTGTHNYSITKAENDFLVSIGWRAEGIGWYGVNLDSDHDGVSDSLEEFFETDVKKDDTDGDGLSDYDEIYITGTDPAVDDSDENGISDAEEDPDEDGLTNAEEVEYGTNPQKSDTDGDGLSDYDEIHVYHTSPTEADTDGDGILDGDELDLGLDPTKGQSDGSTPDAERTFEQELDDSMISESLQKDNSMIPSISGNVSGNINRHVTMEETSIASLADNRAVQGKQLHLETDYEDGADLRLSFAVEESDERSGYYMICRYDDNEFVPCETTNENGKIWTAAGSGDYFVVDAEQLLIDLDIPIEKYKDAAVEESLVGAAAAEEAVPEAPSNDVSEEWYQENYVIVDENNQPVITEEEAAEEDEDDDNEEDTEEDTEEDVTDHRRELAEGEKRVLAGAVDSLNEEPVVGDPGGAAGQADIVFVIDTTGSMSGAINNVVKNIDGFVDALYSEYGVKANFALIDYKDITCDEETKLVKNGSSNWFSDVTAFKSQISSLYVTGGGDGPETPIDALAMAEQLDFRQSANKFAILVTDANYKTNNNYGITDMSAMAKLLNQDGIVTSVISSTSYQSTYKELYDITGGVFGNIYGDFKSVLLQLAERIGEIVNDGSWVLLSDYQFIKLKQPLENNSFSSDEDSISDFNELGTKTVSDVSPYINWVLKKYNIPEGMYDDPTTVQVYKYISNPVLKDTDFDGINDDREMNDHLKRSHQFFAHEKYQTGGTSYNTEVNFQVDYSTFFGDNSTYKQNLAVLASLFSLDMYNDGYLELSYGASGSSKSENGKSLGTIFGLDGKTIDADKLLKNYASDSTVDTDDISEVYIGHRTVTYGGEERDVFFLIVRGTNGTNAEWSSNFDVGANTAEYTSMTGSHADWKNQNNHKGFDVTTNRILKAFNQYVGELQNSGQLSSGGKRSIFISGHSRGAAIANLLGAHFEDDSAYKSFTYTMAAPYTTTVSSAGSYQSIFNIVNTDDLVPYLPLEHWGFKRYGRDLKLSAEVFEDKNPFGDSVETFEFLFGHDYDTNAWLHTAVSSFEKVANNRSELYRLDTTSGDGVVIDGSLIHYDDSKFTKYTDLQKKGKLDKFCKTEKNKLIKGYNIKVTYCPAYLMQIIANLAGAPSGTSMVDWIGIDLKGKYSAARRDFALASGKIPVVGAIPGGMECPHMPATYYMMTSQTPYSSYKVG